MNMIPLDYARHPPPPQNVGNLSSSPRPEAGTASMVQTTVGTFCLLLTIPLVSVRCFDTTLGLGYGICLFEIAFVVLAFTNLIAEFYRTSARWARPASAFAWLSVALHIGFIFI